jgi:hypothetical protein
MSASQARGRTAGDARITDVSRFASLAVARRRSPSLAVSRHARLYLPRRELLDGSSALIQMGDGQSGHGRGPEKTMRASRSCLVVFAVSMLAASGCSAAPEERAPHASLEQASREGEALSTGEEDGGAYSFFVASTVHGGYRVAALNGAPIRCAEGHWANACRVTSIDLSPTLLGGTDADALRAQLGSDPTVATIAFVGKLTLASPSSPSSASPAFRRSRAEPTLTVWETWRAPEPRLLWGPEWLHVSHGATRALLVNWWDETDVSKLDLSAAPMMSYCHVVAGQYVCEQSHDGVVHVRQYYLKIDVGQARLPNGYWYCRADQIACDDGDCPASEAECHAQTAHGRGLLTYTRTSAEVVQPWFVSTTQLTAAETAPAP